MPCQSNQLTTRGSSWCRSSASSCSSSCSTSSTSSSTFSKTTSYSYSSLSSSFSFTYSYTPSSSSPLHLHIILLLLLLHLLLHHLHLLHQPPPFPPSPLRGLTPSDNYGPRHGWQRASRWVARCMRCLSAVCAAAFSRLILASISWRARR